MIDLHSHVLPALDDGATDLAESLAILRAMADDGVRVVAATPHVRDDYPTSGAAMGRALAAVREAVAVAGLGIEVLGGGEIALDRLPSLSPAEREALGLGGNPRLLLLEMPYGAWPLPLTHVVAELGREGLVPVIAHPERNLAVLENPSLLEEPVRLGAVIQLTAASVDGRFGQGVQRCARVLIDRGLAHLIASDAHAPGLREAGLSTAVDALGSAALARWYVDDVPAALLAGQPLPERPEIPRPRRRLFGR